jgi:hypothetical protein
VTKPSRTPAYNFVPRAFASIATIYRVLLELKLDRLDPVQLADRVEGRSATFDSSTVSTTASAWHTMLGNLSPTDYESQHAAMCSA